MTFITNTQFLEDQATRTVFESPKSPVPYPGLLYQAQGEVGRDIGKAIKTGMQWAGNQGANFRRMFADATRPPAAV